MVEDEPTQRRQLRLKLEEQGYNVIEAENGWEGVQQFLKNSEIRLIITDLLMPEMDGFQFVEVIREMQNRYVYIIALTILEDKNSIIRAMALGVDDYICKPVFREELILRLASAQRLLKLESQDELILAMAKLSSYNSGETGKHLDRIKEYCLILAHDLNENYPELGLTPSTAQEISDVSALHDIGKVGVSGDILQKEDSLNSEEFEEIKQHTLIGGQLFKEIYGQTGAPYLRLAYEISMYHHEKWDGTGYPEGLAGENIPIAARILALADVFDALTVRQCYRDFMSEEEAREIIIKESGKHFDPKVVDAFLRQEDLMVEVMKSYPEDVAS